jgi:SAM-dependent methyltransferase
MSWTKGLSGLKRKALVNEVQFHRRRQVLFPSHPYTAFRNLVELGSQGEALVDLVRRLAKRKRVRIFDAGAGMLGLSGDLKQIFGKKVHVTALTLRHPNTSAKTEQESVKTTRKNVWALKRMGVFPNGIMYKGKEPADALAEYHSSIIQKARESSRKVDEVKVGLFENLDTNAKYDVIVDFCGALSYSTNQKRAVEVLNKMLPKNGVIVIGSMGVAYREIRTAFKVTEFPAGWDGKKFYVLRKK